MGITQGTSLLGQSSFSLHCHICCFISQSEVKFLCGIYNCRNLKYNIRGPDHKTHIYIESGLFPQFF